MNANNKVWATIVTFNRLELLKECVSAVRNQTLPVHQILVVDNSSTDGTAEWLKLQNDIRVVTQPNAGSSGGQYTAFKIAYENGADWVWTMDDDSLPYEDCLGYLLEFGENSGLPYVAPNLEDYEGVCHFEKIWNNTPFHHADIEGGPFNGGIFSRFLISKIGFPNKDFFIWGDEYEYTDRIRNLSIPLMTVRDAMVKHPSTKMNYKTCKRIFYYVRNQVWRMRLNTYKNTSKKEYQIKRVYVLFLCLTRLFCHFNVSGIYDFFKGIAAGVFTSPEYRGELS
ncbi:MAG: glycosyltransferase [Pirellulales bacterium]|nr:glycosyltransferase [Pirellulales bacterium]